MINEPLKPGYLLRNRYAITHRRAISGVGALYQARDLQAPAPDRRLCAVKESVLDAPTPQGHLEAVDDFIRRSKRLAELSHPAIPAVYDYFVEGDCSYLVTEFIQGEDLEDLLSNGNGLAAPLIHRWALDLCDVLHYLHTRPTPIIYRDLKPSNVMIDERSRVVLIDFGIAAWLDDKRHRIPLGTDGYAAPEQYWGELSPGIDVYGLGATLHHLLTGSDPRLEPPFTFALRPVRKLNPAVPEPFAAAVMRAVERDPWKRFGSMVDMKQALEQVTWA